MALFEVQVTRFDPTSNRWTPICHGPCLARVVASPCSIILSDVSMNHVKTINLASGFNFQQQQAKHYIVITAVTTYGFVLPDAVAGQSFEVAVQGLLKEQQRQLPPSLPHGQTQQKLQPQPQLSPRRYQEQHEATNATAAFPPTPPPIPKRTFGRNVPAAFNYAGPDGVATMGGCRAMVGNPFQTAPLPRPVGDVSQGGFPDLYGPEQWQQQANQEHMINPFQSYGHGRHHPRAYSLDYQQQPQAHDNQHVGVTRRQTAPSRHSNNRQWSCSACTLLNQHNSVKCSVCGTKNPNHVPVADEAIPRVVEAVPRVVEAVPHVVEAVPRVMFHEAKEDYDCPRCSLRNRATAVRCEACNTPNPEPWIVIPAVDAQPAAGALRAQGTPPGAPNEAVAVAVEVNDGEWFCGACTSRNDAASVNCVVCLTPGPKRLAVAEEAEDDGWTCGACTLKNYPTVKKCTACNGNRPADYVVPPNHEIRDEERQIHDADKLEHEMKKLQLTQIFSLFGIHLLPNPEPFVCPLCQSNVEKGAGVALFQCFHFFCKTCLVALVKASDGLNVMCPYRDAIACECSLKMHEIKELLSADEYKTYLDKTAAAARASDVTFHCRTADCCGWCFAADVDGKFVCPLCEVETCVVCRFSHAGMSCEQYNNLVQEIPEEWVQDGQYQDQLLHPLAEDSPEWRRVEDFFNSNLQTQCQVVKIERCQNKDLWRKYAWQKKLMEERNGKDNLNEKLLFHGTRQNNPAEIWRGNEGFDLRHCQNGAWGRGSYFAENSQYSLGYAYNAGGTRRQMFVAKVLTGFTCEMAANNALTMPPVRLTRPDGVKVLHDSVSGVGGGSKIFIVYQLDVAYPAYLITYDLQQ